MQRYVSKERVRPTEEEIRANARARGRRHYHRHREKYREKYAAEREARRQQKRAYNAQNPGVGRAATRKRRARKRGADQAQHIDPLVVLEMTDGMCGICGHDLDPINYEIDHVIPLSRGGTHTYDNVQAAHRMCNRVKFTSLPGDHPEVMPHGHK